MWGSYRNIKPDELGDVVSLRPVSLDTFILQATSVVLYDERGNTPFPNRLGIGTTENKAAYVCHFEAFDMLMEARIMAYDTDLSSIEVHSLTTPLTKTRRMAQNSIEILMFEGFAGRSRQTLCEDLTRLQVKMGRTTELSSRRYTPDFTKMSRLFFIKQFDALLRYRAREVKNGFLSVEKDCTNSSSTSSTLKGSQNIKWDCTNADW